MEWALFFPPDTPVLALPNWEAPRVYIPAHTLGERWRASAFFPAFRLRGRAYRWVVRVSAAAMTPRRTPERGGQLEELVADVLPGARSSAVCTGSPGFTQKYTTVLRDADGRVVGYLKCADKPEAVKRLRHEAAVLEQLPQGLGPRRLKYSVWAGGEALLTAPVEGPTVNPCLPVPSDVAEFCRSLPSSRACPVSEHPWIHELTDLFPGDIRSMLDPLSNREWPVILQHGDLTWNVLRTATGPVALDWEYGKLRGFPGIDEAAYVLQTANMVYGWSPRRTLDAGITHLARRFTVPEATALMKLAAHSLFQFQWHEGWKLDDPVQQWRKALWELAP